MSDDAAPPADSSAGGDWHANFNRANWSLPSLSQISQSWQGSDNYAEGERDQIQEPVSDIIQISDDCVLRERVDFICSA